MCSFSSSLKLVTTKIEGRYTLYVYECSCGKFYHTYDDTKLPKDCGSCNKKMRRIPGRPEILTDEYKEWRKKVFAMNRYTCQCCGSKKDLVAHHLNAWNWDLSGRYTVKNGITLCGGKKLTQIGKTRTKNCHDTFHSIYGVGNNTIYQFENFINKYYGKSLRDIGYDL